MAIRKITAIFFAIFTQWCALSYGVCHLPSVAAEGRDSMVQDVFLNEDSVVWKHCGSYDIAYLYRNELDTTKYSVSTEESRANMYQYYSTDYANQGMARVRCALSMEKC